MNRVQVGYQAAARLDSLRHALARQVPRSPSIQESSCSINSLHPIVLMFSPRRSNRGAVPAALRSSRAFARIASCSNSRSRTRALCSCDFEFPIEQPMISAISLCSYPCTSCKNEHCLVPRRQLLHGALQVHPVNRAAEPQIRGAKIPPRPSRFFVRLGHLLERSLVA